jgi:hypothetical protein
LPAARHGKARGIVTPNSCRSKATESVPYS